MCSLYFCHFHNEETLHKEVKRNDMLKWAPLYRLITSLFLRLIVTSNEYPHRRSVNKKLGVPMLNESYYNFTNELYLEIKWYNVRNYRRVSLRHFVLANITMICEVESDFVML